MKTLAKIRLLVTRFPYASQWGGEEVHTLTLMNALRSRGVESFFMGSCPLLLRAFEEAGFEVKQASLGKPPVTIFQLLMFVLSFPYFFLKAGFLLRRARLEWSVNTVYMHSLGEKLLMTPWALHWGMKVVWVEHARLGSWLLKNPFLPLYKYLAPRVELLGTSAAMAAELRAVAPTAKAISCAAVLEKATPLREELREFMSSGFAVLCVARLTVDKGVDMLVQLARSKPDLRVVLVGEGPLLSTLQRKAAQTVRFIPSLPRGELMSLYKAADLLVLPSRKMDPFGMVAAEAMALGTPVLVTTVCGIAADLKNGVEALVVAPTVSAIDKGLKKVMAHAVLRKRLGLAGQRFAQKHYDLDRMVDAFEDLLTR